MIIGIAVFFWLLAFCLAIRLLMILRSADGGGRAFFMIWTAALLAAALLLFRPHEDIFGGEDPGSYINSGITYGRELKFFHADPLLSQVPPAARPLFFYGHAGYGTTKDACLWVRDVDNAVIGPHFQPAYPLLISMASRLLGAGAALYVIPLFAIFAGLALGSLATQCIAHRWSGISAFILWTMNPLVLWHGRCARPEIIAAFLFFGGTALLARAWNNKPWLMWRDIILGALCIGFAPMFHVTAWLLVAPAVLALALMALTGRTDYFLAPLVLVILPAAALVYQVRRVTDYYGIYHFISFPLRHPLLSAAIAVACLCCAASIWFAHRKAVCENDKRLPLALGAALALATMLFMVVSLHTRDAQGSLPFLGRPIYHYFYLTDLKTLVNMVSRPVAALALAGWAAWLTGRSRFRRSRAVIALAVFPGMMLAGNTNDFMMTRYLLVSIVPMSALGITALVSLIPDRPRIAPAAAVTALLIGIAGLHSRTHLATLIEHKGFAGFLRPFAREINVNNGILLCEYSRIAAPFDHFFGIPTLGLDNERQDDYSRQEQAWAAIMRNNPERGAFFITPFQRPLSDRFDFDLLRSAVFEDRSLQQAYNNLPTRINEGPIPLSMYRMTVRKPDAEAREMDTPALIAMDAGNMGVSGFANIRVRARPVKGIEWTAGEQISLDLSGSADFSGSTEIFFLMIVEEPYPRAPLVARAGETSFEMLSREESAFCRLTDGWWALRIMKSAWTDQNSLVLKADSPMFLADAFMLTDGNPVSVMTRLPTDRMTERVIPPFKARWARSRADALIPVPAGGSGTLLVFFEAPETGQELPSEFGISREPGFEPEMKSVETSRWQWGAWSLRAPDAGDRLRIGLHTSPPWNSGLRGFPSDLGVLVGYIVVLPAH